PTWTTPDGKTHEGAELVAEPFTPDADTFRADTAGRTVIDMPLRRPEHYAAKLEAATDAADIARLNRHFALAHIQELQWRRWGRQNPKALEAMQKVADAIGKKADGTLNLTLGDITLLGSAGQRYTAETWAKKSGIADNTPVLAYYAKRHHGWQKVAELRKSVPGGLIGHLAAYHAAVASSKDVAPMRSFVRDFGRSPLLYAAAAWQEQPERLLELTDHPRWGLLAIVKAAQRAKTDVHRDRIAAAFAKMHAKLTDAGAELPIPPKIAALLKRGDGAHWKAVLAGARKVAFDSKHIAPLLRLAELAMLNAETALADEAVAQARSLAGEDRPLLLALTVAQAYWAGNRQKDALALYEQVLATLKKKDVPPSATLLAAAARLAQQAGDMGKAIDLEERALAIEHETLPEMINLQAFRQRYQWLWGRYQEKVNQAVQAKKMDEAALWVDRAARLWRRWFDVDGENRGLLTQMATLQLTAGNKDAAWLYLSSLIDAKPKDAGTFAHLAQWHLGRKEHAKAADYYAQAFTWDTANPQWLYQQGQALKTLGRTEDANRVLDQIIDGKWAPGLQRYQKRAKELKDK
ncbi:hypothetical protein HQ560_12675, partial [bacterium]|nr:hypothetical protein [bacterium]